MVSTKEIVGGVKRSSEEFFPRETPIEEFGRCFPGADPGFLLEAEADTDGRGGRAWLDSFFRIFSGKLSC